MEYMQKRAVATQILVTSYVAGAFERARQKGQGSVEYAGIVLVVAAVIAAAITLLASDNFIGEAVKKKVEAAFNKLK